MVDRLDRGAGGAPVSGICDSTAKELYRSSEVRCIETACPLAGMGHAVALSGISPSIDTGFLSGPHAYQAWVSELKVKMRPGAVAIAVDGNRAANRGSPSPRSMRTRSAGGLS